MFIEGFQFPDQMIKMLPTDRTRELDCPPHFRNDANSLSIDATKWGMGSRSRNRGTEPGCSAHYASRLPAAIARGSHPGSEVATSL